MTYRIAQSSERTGRDYWRWSAWLEGEEAELDAVDHVVWILHPTFKRPRVRTADRSQKFRLDTAGWGTFLLKAEVAFKDNSESLLLKHQLELETESTPAPARVSVRSVNKRERPSIFLSYSVEDARRAARLRESLEKAGVEVLDQTRIAAGEILSGSLQSMIDHSDAVIGLVSEDGISPWVGVELEAAVSSEKPVLALLTSEGSDAGIPETTQKLSIDAFDASAIASLLGDKWRP